MGNWIALLEHNPSLLYGLVALFSLAVGSFLNVVIHRLPKMLEYDWRQECAALTGKETAAPPGPRLSLVYPPSHCRHCGHRIRALENILFRLLTGKAGMGFGDFKLLAMLGAWLGWQYLPQIILLSACTGALVGTTLILVRRQDLRIPISFGPYLAVTGWIGLMWGDAINRAYLQWAGLA